MIPLQMIRQPNFKFLVKGDHPAFMRIDRKCVSYDEAVNVKDGLKAVGYEVEIEDLNNVPETKEKIRQISL
ncbi:hypothetical protein LCGC14_1037140 [marine sediment metagenome]|uniref:Uncharacterized protein n=1 Tax=marine sediment metagenome TaxID=412755 RepID=A0A0F9QZ12_9ZZZZ